MWVFSQRRPFLLENDDGLSLAGQYAGRGLHRNTATYKQENKTFTKKLINTGVIRRPQHSSEMILVYQAIHKTLLPSFNNLTYVRKVKTSPQTVNVISILCTLNILHTTRAMRLSSLHLSDLQNGIASQAYVMWGIQYDLKSSTVLISEPAAHVFA